MKLGTRSRSALIALMLCTAFGACGDGGPPTEPPVAPPPEPPVEPPPMEPPAPALPAGIFALAGITAGLPHTDLAPLRDIVGSARWVALGESTHMSGGYYEAKHRLIRYLVQEMGFRAVGFESPWHESEPAARYVATCQGSVRDALHSMYPVWRDTHVRALLEWLCAWNRDNPGDPVTFYGFDIQEPGRSTIAVEQFLSSAAPAHAARAEPLRQCLGATHYNTMDYFGSPEYAAFRNGVRNAAAHEACIAGITDLESFIPGLAGGAAPAAIEEALISLVQLRAWENQLWIPDPGGYESRDHGMAEVARRVHALHTPTKKTVLWAWNWHIALNYPEVRGFNDDPSAVVGRQGARAMGSFMREALGSDYLPIGLIGWRVDMPLGFVQIPTQTHPQSVERRLYDLNKPWLLVDLARPVGDTLIPPGATLRVSQEWGDPYRQFGALLFLRNSPAMFPVP